MKDKSPFLVLPEFVSPLMCDNIVGWLDFGDPDLDPGGRPIESHRLNSNIDEYMSDRISDIANLIEEHFNVSIVGTTSTWFHMLPEGCDTTKPICDNSSYTEKWVRTRDIDFTFVLFLSDYSSDSNFDDDYEVYGGKMEFPQHGFGFNPQRGTVIAFPSLPQFIHLFTEVFAGDLFFAKGHFKTEDLYLYNPSKFPGSFKTWFRDIGA